ncbi:MAG TPA: cytochrome c3 family protein [Candidatus Methanoperedens sp.]|nr:cytochrome c3 family protein [Candidatus Methanoperedens sp.]HLB71084.1 cytochrome c3 family protein [Candidatus Methanoperedens sp.]
METLVEYLTYVKGIGYLVVVAFLFAFITFWLLVHTKNKDIIKTVPVVVMIWLAFGVASALVSNGHNTNGHDAKDETALEPAVEFPEYYSNGSPATITAHRVEKWLGVNNTEYLAISYGSASNFHKVMSEKIACTDCHHNSKDEIHACSDCHSAPFDPEDLSKPGLKAAIHTRCMYCHKEVFGGPEDCKLCHTMDTSTSVAVAAPERPHALTWEDCVRCHKDGIPGGQKIKIVYHDFCIKCHTKGIADAAKLPEDHAGRAGDTCKGCHKPAGG